MQNNNPPRPPRSLRDRNAARSTGNGDLPPTSHISSQKDASKNEPVYEKHAHSYLDSIDETEDIIEDDFEDAPIPETTKQQNVNSIVQKPKVQVLNVRQNNKISTDKSKEESKKKIQEEAAKVKNELEKVTQDVSKTKEDLNKIGGKIVEDAQQVKEKVTEAGLKAVESIISAPVNMLSKLFFGSSSKTSQKATANTTQQKISQKKVIPKIKYASLLEKRIEFLAYDKETLVDKTMPSEIIEDIFMANAMADTKYCTKFVKDLPCALSGPYGNKRIVDIFENIKAEDINNFLYYVSNNPDAFIGVKYKFSEAFATWIIRKSHELYK
jgi:hypothetical protein